MCAPTTMSATIMMETVEPTILPTTKIAIKIIDTMKNRAQLQKKWNRDMDSRMRFQFATVKKLTNKRPPPWYSQRLKGNCQRIISKITEVNKDCCQQQRLTLK